MREALVFEDDVLPVDAGGNDDSDDSIHLGNLTEEERAEIAASAGVGLLEDD
jgi:hypothetical protein